jgi:hypothetical protein
MVAQSSTEMALQETEGAHLLSLAVSRAPSLLKVLSLRKIDPSVGNRTHAPSSSERTGRLRIAAKLRNVLPGIAYILSAAGLLCYVVSGCWSTSLPTRSIRRDKLLPMRFPIQEDWSTAHRNDSLGGNVNSPGIASEAYRTSAFESLTTLYIAARFIGTVLQIAVAIYCCTALASAAGLSLLLYSARYWM